MTKRDKHCLKVRARAVRVVFERGSGYGSQWEAMVSIAADVACTAQTLRRWVRRRVWRQLGRQGRRVARCTVERLMRPLGRRDAIRSGELALHQQGKREPPPCLNPHSGSHLRAPGAPEV